MALFPTFKAINAYEKYLKSFGVNYLAIPTSLNGFVRDQMIKQCQSNAKWSGAAPTTDDLDACMAIGAEVVAHCVVGPAATSQRLGNYATVELECDVFAPWIRDGADANVYTRIASAFVNSGLACPEFVTALKLAKC